MEDTFKIFLNKETVRSIIFATIYSIALISCNNDKKYDKITKREVRLIASSEQQHKLILSHFETSSSETAIIVYDVLKHNLPDGASIIESEYSLRCPERKLVIRSGRAYDVDGHLLTRFGPGEWAEPQRGSLDDTLMNRVCNGSYINDEKFEDALVASKLLRTR